MSKVTQISTRDHKRKLRFGESWIDRGYGWERAVSSEMLDIFAQMQVLLDDMVLELGIPKTRKQVTRILEEVFEEYKRDN